jgi:hypothetical protein
VYVDGAMDGWRYRDAAYEAFSADLIRRAASDAVPPIAITVSSRLTALDSAIDAVVRIRETPPGTASAAAQLIAPDGGSSAVRLWPPLKSGRSPDRSVPSWPAHPERHERRGDRRRAIHRATA